MPSKVTSIFKRIDACYEQNIFVERFRLQSALRVIVQYGETPLKNILWPNRSGGQPLSWV